MRRRTLPPLSCASRQRRVAAKPILKLAFGRHGHEGWVEVQLQIFDVAQRLAAGEGHADGVGGLGAFAKQSVHANEKVRTMSIVFTRSGLDVNATPSLGS